MSVSQAWMYLVNNLLKNYRNAFVQNVRETWLQIVLRLTWRNVWVWEGTVVALQVEGMTASSEIIS